MIESSHNELSAEGLERIKQAMHDDEEQALHLLNEAYAAHPGDARLPMLRGAVLAGRGEHERAGIDLRDALALAPHLHVARFMLGYLELTRGASARAVAVWSPLLNLDEDPVLQAFTRGMVSTVQDRFAEAQAAFRAGLAAGDAHADLVPMVRALEEALGAALGQDSSSEAAADANRHWLLAGYLTRH